MSKKFENILTPPLKRCNTCNTELPLYCFEHYKRKKKVWTRNTCISCSRNTVKKPSNRDMYLAHWLWLKYDISKTIYEDFLITDETTEIYATTVNKVLRWPFIHPLANRHNIYDLDSLGISIQKESGLPIADIVEQEEPYASPRRKIMLTKNWFAAQVHKLRPYRKVVKGYFREIDYDSVFPVKYSYNGSKAQYNYCHADKLYQLSSLESWREYLENTDLNKPKNIVKSFYAPSPRTEGGQSIYVDIARVLSAFLAPHMAKINPKFLWQPDWQICLSCKDAFPGDQDFLDEDRICYACRKESNTDIHNRACLAREEAAATSQSLRNLIISPFALSS